ncbi:extracellular solute-binding protein [Primorskyibacter sp. 2E107]|uniref:extracellular solute-binding protein n=1 Tax=Primorskyibacter sp. 2E107 TaxID=3403458 RepID=UPI003AF94084
MTTDTDGAVLRETFQAQNDACGCMAFGRPVDLTVPVHEIVRQVFENDPYWQPTNLMALGAIYISYTWDGPMLGALEKPGIPVAEFIPVEGADGWIDKWMLVKDTPNTYCAYKDMEYMNSPEGQCAVSGVTGYWPTNPGAASCITEEETAEKHVGDPEILESPAMWLTPARPVEYATPGMP